METILPSCTIPLKGIVRTLIFLILILIWGISFGQQDIAINTVTDNTSNNKDSDISDTQYLVLSTDNKISERYKDLEFKLYTSDCGTAYLEIKSEKKRTVLLDIKNKMDDELLFQSVHLKEGENIISFYTDNPAATIFLKLSRFDSNRVASFIVLRK